MVNGLSDAFALTASLPIADPSWNLPSERWWYGVDRKWNGLTWYGLIRDDIGPFVGLASLSLTFIGTLHHLQLDGCCRPTCAPRCCACCTTKCAPCSECCGEDATRENAPCCSCCSRRALIPTLEQARQAEEEARAAAHRGPSRFTGAARTLVLGELRDAALGLCST